jgi:hypothetical protein
MPGISEPAVRPHRSDYRNRIIRSDDAATTVAGSNANRRPQPCVLRQVKSSSRVLNS